MKNLKNIKNKLTTLASNCISLYKDYETILNNISEELDLQNKVASLSNCAVADELTYIIRNIAYAGMESNHETICKYLKQAIEDLASGMDAADVLGKYDKILYDLRNHKPEHRGYRAKILIVDDLCDIDKEELKDIIKEKNMVKLHCDRCGEEIKDKYYTINFWEYETHPKSANYGMADARSCSYSRESALEMLNSQKMYCKKCRNEFENFMNSKG